MVNPVAFCFKRFPLLSRLMIWCLLPLIIVLLMVRGELGKSIPVYQGEVAVQGLSSAVTVNFDSQGIARVTGDTDQDVYFAQGYLHASERMWQMVLQRRLVYGRLSEVFGRSTLASDRWMRTLGLKQAAQQAWDNTRGGPRQALQAYADGVNAWIAQAAILPPEFLFFDLTPEPWQPMDSLAWQKAFALDLGQNFRMEILRLAGLKMMSFEQLATFFPYDDCELAVANCIDANEIELSEIAAVWDNHGENDLAAGQYASWAQLNQEMTKRFGIGERFAGSNSWVVSGQHSRSGMPILANDPHLSLQLPSLWYAMAMKGDKLDVTGMSLVGMPGVLLGRNADISWGATALTGDNQDLFILDVPLKNTQVYQLDGQQRAIVTRTERIDIRADAPQALNKAIEPLSIRVRTTEFGPIVTDVIATDMQAMALRWTALDEQDQSFDAFYHLQYASDWQQFRRALAKLGAPSLHFVYADNKGNIGSQVAGHLPRRSTDAGAWPQFAHSIDDNWQGYVDFDRLPSRYNPSSGMIASANNRIVSEKDVVISHEWAPDTRVRRIRQLLQQKTAQGQLLTLADMVKMQKDEIDIDALAQVKWFEQTGLLDKLASKSDFAQNNLAQNTLDAAIASLKAWDGSYGVESHAATIYHFWLKAFKQDLFYQALKSQHGQQLNTRVLDDLLNLVSQRQLFNIIAGQTTGYDNWCEQVKTQDCQQLLQQSFYQTITKLTKHFNSDDVSQWTWGEVHYVEFAHRPFGEIRLLEKWFSQQLPAGGSADTLNVGSYREDEAGNLKQDFGSVFRQVFDMAQHEQHYIGLGSGQSGHFLSQFYQDSPTDFYDADSAIANDTRPSGGETQLVLLPKTELVSQHSEQDSEQHSEQSNNKFGEATQ